MPEDFDRIRLGWGRTSDLIDIVGTVRVIYEVSIPQTSFPAVISLLVDGHTTREIVSALDLLIKSAGRPSAEELHTLIQDKLSKALKFMPLLKNLRDEEIIPKWELFSEGTIPDNFTEDPAWKLALRLFDSIKTDSKKEPN